MVDFLGFMFFAMLEGYAVFSLAFFTYRIDLQRYLLPSFIIINLIDLQNYLIREEFRLNWAAPLSNLIIMILFITLYVRIPIYLVGHYEFNGLYCTWCYTNCSLLSYIWDLSGLRN
jgi:hypothetical protein